MRILVTGATGLIGSHLCQRLLAAGHTVMGLSRSRRPQLMGQPHPHFRHLRVNIQSASQTAAVFRDNPVEVVFHLAVERVQKNESALPFSATSAYRTNTLGTLNLLQAARDQGVKAWIQSSTMNVYDFENPDYTPVDEIHPFNPRDINGLSMLFAENLCRFYTGRGLMQMLILRYPGVYGLGKSRGIVHGIVRQCLANEKKPIVAPRDRTSDFIYVMDVVDANLLALDALHAQSGKVFNIGSGQATSIPQLARIVCDLTQSKLEIEEIPPRKPRHFYFDIAQAEQHLGYQPRTVKAGLADFIHDIQKTGVPV